MSGYIGNIPVPQATQTRQTFTAIASQTTFNTAGYTAGFVDVYMNGVHLLDGTDYTATNGSDVVLTSGAAAGDVIEVVAYSTYQVNSQNYTGGLTVDNDGATVLTVDRATSDGTIIDVQKNGSTVGSIGAKDGDMYFGTGDTALRFHDGNNQVYPSDTSTGTSRDALTDLGHSGGRFKDLYLSGGVYLGGVGSANYLDDYEEGTWTPEASFAGNSAGITYNNREGVYTKVGRLVTAIIRVALSNNGTATSGQFQISLPFAVSNAMSTTSVQGAAIVGHMSNFSGTHYDVQITPWENESYAKIYYRSSTTGNATNAAGPSQISNSFDCRITVQFMTAA